MTAHSAERGFALPTVLWACLLIAITSSGLLIVGKSLHRTARDALLGAQLAAVDDAAISAAIRDLDRPELGFVRQVDGTPTRWEFEGHRVTIRVQDELGKVDLNLADEVSLERVFVAAGFDQATGEILADRVADWREHGIGKRLNGAKRDDYAAAGLAYGPRQAPFLTVGELRLVLGMTDEIYTRVARAFTVYSENPSVDDTVAPPLVLAAIARLDPAGIQLALARRAQDDGNHLFKLRGLVGRAFLITAETSERGLTVIRTAMVRLTGRPFDPDWIYYWH